MSLSSLSFCLITITSFGALLLGQKEKAVEWEFVKERKNLETYVKKKNVRKRPPILYGEFPVNSWPNGGVSE